MLYERLDNFGFSWIFFPSSAGSGVGGPLSYDRAPVGHLLSWQNESEYAQCGSALGKRPVRNT